MAGYRIALNNFNLRVNPAGRCITSSVNRKWEEEVGSTKVLTGEIATESIGYAGVKGDDGQDI